MIYYNVEKNEEGLFLVENRYDPKFALKTESSFAQCNGYFGVRASFDCKVLNENRGMFVAGFYNKAYENEVSEFVNCPDLTEIQLYLEGEKFSFDSCTVKEYDRRLNVYTGELSISAICELKCGLEVKLESKRFASDDNFHLLCQKFSVTPLNREVKSIEIISGINGQITNSGVSHFKQTECRVYNKRYMSYIGCTGEGILQLISGISIHGGTFISPPKHVLKRRSIYEIDRVAALKNQTVVYEKYSYIDTPKTQECCDTDKKIEFIECFISNGYQKNYEDHKRSMYGFWKHAGISIEGISLEEEAAIRFAQYHIKGMTPRNTCSYSMGAKGLTGEGYKGHVFWDVEIFILPFLLYVFPESARNHLLFRYNGLPKAREKAMQFGYEGAMFPWETAKTGTEETPQYAQLNIHTGKANKVWSWIKECHITADIAYAVWKYYMLTNDHEFMVNYGNEIIFEAAAFWVSRAEYDKERDAYFIKDVIGPDEYDEHVDNNTYTNYMAWYCVKTAIYIMEHLKENQPDQYQKLNDKLNLEKKEAAWIDFVNKTYLPKPDDRQIIPQDDSFLSKKELPDIERYKSSKIKQSILLDYSRDEVVNMQVLKQADVVMLFNLLPHLFDSETVKKNIIFYEKRTIHDSSLSYCAHAQACAKFGMADKAYEFFKKAMEIDINDNPYDSTDGIHAASLGGIWNCVVLGFAGISMKEGTLSIRPMLPQAWKSMKFYIMVRGTYIHINLSRSAVELKCEKPLDDKIPVEVFGHRYELKDCLNLRL